jgi:hypothetical protein
MDVGGYSETRGNRCRGSYNEYERRRKIRNKKRREILKK